MSNVRLRDDYIGWIDFFLNGIIEICQESISCIESLIILRNKNSELLNDKDTLEELLTIVRNEKGRIEAPEGGHDDQMMGLAIAYEIRSQVVYDIDPITPYPEFKEWNMETNAKDYGEQLVVI